MQLIDVPAGSGCFRIEISAEERNWKTLRTVMGEIPVEDLDSGVDVDAFIAGVWDKLQCHGFMKMTLALAGIDVVFIESCCDLHGPEVQSLTYSSELCPAGLVGPWIVEGGL